MPALPQIIQNLDMGAGEVVTFVTDGPYFVAAADQHRARSLASGFHQARAVAHDRHRAQAVAQEQEPDA